MRLLVSIVGVIAVTAGILAIGFYWGESRYQSVMKDRQDSSAWSRQGEPLLFESPPGPARGEEIYAKVCVTCHGKNGEGNLEYNSPAIHQQHDWYVRDQLLKFRSGYRGTDPADSSGTQMRLMSIGLPDRESLTDVTDYLATLNAPPPARTLPGDPHRGREVFSVVCASCHGDDGRGNEATRAPALVGQLDWYLAGQLEKFRNGTRGGHAGDLTGSQMRGMAKTLGSSDEVLNVVAYISTLPPMEGSP